MLADSTNLASEFYVLSVLHRLGANEALTLANKKAVDIIVACGAGHSVTIDVKGSAGTTGWFEGNAAVLPNHFVVFVTYLNKISNPSVVPQVFVVPSTDLPPLIHAAKGGRKLVYLFALRQHLPPYRDNWQAIL